MIMDLENILVSIHDNATGDDLHIPEHTKCPAVLTENLFQYYAADVAFLQSNKGKKCPYAATRRGHSRIFDEIATSPSKLK